MSAPISLDANTMRSFGLAGLAAWAKSNSITTATIITTDDDEFTGELEHHPAKPNHAETLTIGTTLRVLCVAMGAGWSESNHVMPKALTLVGYPASTEKEASNA